MTAAGARTRLLAKGVEVSRRELEAANAEDGWTRRRVAVLTKLWEAGYSASQVATLLGGVTRSAVLGKAHRLGLAGRDQAAPPRQVAPELTKAAPAAKPTAAALRAPPTKEDPHVTRVTAAKLQAAVDAPPPAPLPQEPVQDTARVDLVALLDLKPHQCRWPIGTPGQPGFGFCGCPMGAREPYCPDHATKAWTGLPPKAPRSGNELMRSLRKFVA